MATIRLRIDFLIVDAENFLKLCSLKVLGMISSNGAARFAQYSNVHSGLPRHYSPSGRFARPALNPSAIFNFKVRARRLLILDRVLLA